ncbi:Hypothetical protein FKW44_018978 [Caligus rogercresseyi]|uniref:Uncharacterized protein n=1 Tax=Caligus rogercresseyi TaxID=217165 RepID=A0A7T8JX40_CALRO|nr:Hypothetical protein FKW44_018978 [Caligus rogercresseyi]
MFLLFSAAPSVCVLTSFSRGIYPLLRQSVLLVGKLQASFQPTHQIGLVLGPQNAHLNGYECLGGEPKISRELVLNFTRHMLT